MAQQRHIVRGVVAGTVGGLIAAWVMNQFMAGPGVKLQHAVQTDQENKAQEQQAAAQAQTGEPTIDATMKTADAIVNVVSGGRHLSLEGKETGGPVVHYAFGALMGGVYGGVAECSSLARSGFGTTFGGVLFSVADLVAVPALHLSDAPSDAPIDSYASHLAAHLVYGATTELVRRVVRLLL